MRISGLSVLATLIAGPVLAQGSPTPASGIYGAFSASFGQPDTAFTQFDVDPDYEDGTLGVDDSTGLSAAIGYDLGSGLRIEAEILGLRGDTGLLFFPDATAPFNQAVTDGDLRSTTGMVNGWYSFGGASVRPFVGAGIGLSHVEIDTAFTLGDNNGITDSDTVFAWQVGLGAEIPVSDRMSIITSYRYMQASGLEIEDNEGTSIEADVDTGFLTVGTLFRF